MGNKLGLLVWGAVFGFTLSRTGASEYDLIHRMFTGEDLSLAFLMVTAIVVGAIGMRVLRSRGNRTVRGDLVVVKQKPLSPLNAFGGALFGVGWGLSGACPGTVLAQLGEGKLLAVCTVLGLLAGTYLYAALVERWKWLKA